MPEPTEGITISPVEKILVFPAHAAGWVKNNPSFAIVRLNQALIDKVKQCAVDLAEVEAMQIVKRHDGIAWENSDRYVLEGNGVAVIPGCFWFTVYRSTVEYDIDTAKLGFDEAERLMTHKDPVIYLDEVPDVEFEDDVQESLRVRAASGLAEFLKEV